MADIEPKKNWFARHKVITGILVLIIAIAALGSGDDNSSSSTSNETAAPASQEQTAATPQNEPEVKSYKSGTYKVGTDMPAGEYRLISDGSAGYMQISSDSTGSFDSIIANANFNTNAIVTVASGQYFKLTRATAYLIDESPAVDTNKEGTFKIGKDLPAGEYKMTSEGSGYVQVASNSSQVASAIVSNDNFTGDSYITVSNGQYLTLTRAHLVK